jgi:hypothetical protein
MSKNLPAVGSAVVRRDVAAIAFKETWHVFAVAMFLHSECNAAFL